MAQYVLIENTTRMIIHITKDQKTAPTGFSYITVADDYSLSGPLKKLDTDNTTQVAATTDEINSFRDVMSPERVTTRALRNKALALYNASTTSQELKEFLVAFRNWVKEAN